MTNQDKPTTWADMTPEEKGALLLAKHEGGRIEVLFCGEWKRIDALWHEDSAYRIAPEPKRETATMVGHNRGYWCFGSDCFGHRDTHRITFDTIDGKPDCATIRMGRLT